jgi:hypothetical protein
MKFTERIGEQFHKPTGFGGSLATFVMNRQNWRQYVGAETALNLGGTESVLDIGFGNGYLWKGRTAFALTAAVLFHFTTKCAAIANEPTRWERRGKNEDCHLEY